MTLVCEQDGCPLAADGRCLEGLEDPAQCPHTQEVDGSDGPQTEELEDTETPETAAAVDHSDDALVEAAAAPAMVDLAGDQSLSISEAEAVAARYAASVVLVAGAFFSGKTTLVAGLYGLFLDGPAADWNFAGSTSLVALDARYHGKRAVTGLTEPESQRTRDEDMRVLDLRLAGPSRRVNLMFSDVRGEYFEDVVSGRPVGDAVSLASRTDLLIVLLDGEHLADRYERGPTISFARQLIGGLTEPGGLRRGLPIALVVSKADKLGDDDDVWLDEQVDQLAEFAAQRGMGNVERFATAAFAKADHPENLGLARLLEWLVADRSPEPRAPVPDNPEGVRSYLRGPAGG
jgi:hypothetical protein